MGISLWQIAIVVIVVILLFGRGKISDLMGDVAKGIRNFREGISEDASGDDSDAKEIEGETAEEATSDTKDKAGDAS